MSFKCSCPVCTAVTLRHEQSWQFLSLVCHVCRQAQPVCICVNCGRCQHGTSLHRRCQNRPVCTSRHLLRGPRVSWPHAWRRGGFLCASSQGPQHVRWCAHMLCSLLHLGASLCMHAASHSSMQSAMLQEPTRAHHLARLPRTLDQTLQHACMCHRQCSTCSRTAVHPAGEDDGFLVTFVHDESATEGGSAMVVYDAKTMSSTPVARVPLPQRVSSSVVLPINYGWPNCTLACHNNCAWQPYKRLQLPHNLKSRFGHV